MGKNNLHIEHNKEVISTFFTPTIVLHMAHFAPALNVKWGLGCGFILYYCTLFSLVTSSTIFSFWVIAVSESFSNRSEVVSIKPCVLTLTASL